MGLIPNRSSYNPSRKIGRIQIKKSTISNPFTKKEYRNIEIKKGIKKPTPPRREVNSLWIFLLSGLS
jgi:hypothetical protein